MKRVTWVDHQGFLLVLASSPKGKKRTKHRCESRRAPEFAVHSSGSPFARFERGSAAAVSEPLINIASVIPLRGGVHNTPEEADEVAYHTGFQVDLTGSQLGYSINYSMRVIILPTPCGQQAMSPAMVSFLVSGICYVRRTLGRSSETLIVSREVLTKRRFVLKLIQRSSVKGSEEQRS